jgi:hypothetical protein
MTLIRIQNDSATGQAYVNFRYDSGVVAMIRNLHGRSYDPTTKTWTISLGDAPSLTSALEGDGHTIEMVVPQMKKPDDFFAPANSDDFDAAGAARDILAKIEPKFQGKVFRAIARQLYPDLYVSPK